MRLSVRPLRFPWLGLEAWFRSPTEELACESPPNPRLGLVLSCGGARGLAHVGVIQVLEEARIPVAAIMGSSMGAYVGSLWAAGVDGKGLMELAAEFKNRGALLRLLDPVLPPITGLLR